MKKTVVFKDKLGNLAKIEIELNEGCFSMSGDCAGSSGQCQDSIKPKNKAQKNLLELWKKYHLNDMKAGTPKQEAALHTPKFEEFYKLTDGHDYYKAACTWLEKKRLYTVDDPRPDHKGEKYNYGHAWLTEALPANLWEQVESICAFIEAAEKEEKEALVKKERSDIDDPCIVALGLNLGLSPAEALEDISGEDNQYRYAGTDYFVGTYEAAVEAVKEYIKESAWAFNANFLAAFCDIPEEVFTALQDKCEGANEAVLTCIERADGGLDEFTEQAISADGIGHFLNSWDGSDDTQTVDEIKYTICRTN